LVKLREIHHLGEISLETGNLPPTAKSLLEYEKLAQFYEKMPSKVKFVFKKSCFI